MLRLPAFTYLQPRTLQDALAMKADAGPDGMYVAGGTDLYPNMKRRHQEPRTVISLMGVSELRHLGSGERYLLVRASRSRSFRPTHPYGIGTTRWRPLRGSSAPPCSGTWAPWAGTSASTRAAITTIRRTSGARRSTSA